MKKALFLSMILGGSIMLLPSVEANAATPSANVTAPQIRVQIGQNRRNRRIRRVENRRIRTVTTTRVRRVGFRTYRETIRTTYLPNGRRRTVTVRRVRVR